MHFAIYFLMLLLCRANASFQCYNAMLYSSEQSSSFSQTLIFNTSKIADFHSIVKPPPLLFKGYFKKLKLKVIYNLKISN